jgi:restriction system protein
MRGRSVAVPDYETLMLPVLRAVADGEPVTARSLREAVATEVGLSAEDRAAKIPSGKQSVFENRVGWATTYLVQAGLLVRPKRAVVTITQRGRDVLQANPERVDNTVLETFPEFQEFKNRSGTRRRPERTVDTSTSTDDVGSAPRERLAQAVAEANAAVAEELLRRVREREPAFLESLVLELLTAMGYGGREGAAQHLGGSGDEGLDGVIRQDALGLERVYVQAKRYAAENAVSRPAIQGFVGALHGAQADRGIFITTSRFTPEAQSYAEKVNARLILIDGERLGDLMVSYNVGVQEDETFVLKEIDEDYFEE